MVESDDAGKHEAVEIPSTSEISSITFSGQMGDEQSHLLLYEVSD